MKLVPNNTEVMTSILNKPRHPCEAYMKMWAFYFRIGNFHPIRTQDVTFQSILPGIEIGISDVRISRFKLI